MFPVKLSVVVNVVGDDSRLAKPDSVSSSSSLVTLYESSTFSSSESLMTDGDREISLTAEIQVN